MANPHPKLENLTSYKPKWQSGKTRTIRVPIAIADEVLKFARLIDEHYSPDTSDIDPQKIALSLLKTNQDQLTDANEPGKRELMKIIIADAFTIRANKGGEIKKSLARVAVLLGFKVERKGTNKGWIIKGN